MLTRAASLPIEPLLWPANGKDAARVSIVGQHPRQRAHYQVWIARQVTFRHKIMPQPPAVIVSEPIPPIVAMPAELGCSWLQFHQSVIGSKSNIMAAQVELLVLADRVHNSAASSI